jgi:hypothetical protein
MGGFAITVVSASIADRYPPSSPLAGGNCPNRSKVPSIDCSPLVKVELTQLILSILRKCLERIVFKKFPPGNLDIPA